jgi:hypothetical protein
LTEDPDPVGADKMLIEAGIEHTWTQRFPVSGLEGNLLRGPLVGLSSGMGSSAELQVDGLSWSRLVIRERFDAPFSSRRDQGEQHRELDDIVMGAKLRLLKEAQGRPSFGLRFATRLPISGNEKGIGTDTMDFFQSFLIGKSIASTRVVGNFGLGILSDPTRGNRQNDVVTYGLSVVQGIQNFAIVADANGLVSTRDGTTPPGTGTRGTYTVGIRYSHGPVRFDGGFYGGLTGPDERSGVTMGLTWTFEGILGE